MGNFKIEHRQFCVSTASPIVLEVAIVKTQKQHAKVRVIQ
jgi:hypothetical protein